MALSLDMGRISPQEKGLLLWGLYFCSIYLKIKVSDPPLALPLGLLSVGEFLNPSGGRGRQRIGKDREKEAYVSNFFYPNPRRDPRKCLTQNFRHVKPPAHISALAPNLGQEGIGGAKLGRELHQRRERTGISTNVIPFLKRHVPPQL